MTVKKKIWWLFIFFALFSIGLWHQLSYPRFSFIHIPIHRRQALEIAERFLAKERQVDISEYQRVLVFISDENADHYLQKAIGLKGEENFIREHNFDLFLWVVRFFKENTQEEYRLTVSATTGQITAFYHTIEQTAYRDPMDSEVALKEATRFLKERFHFDPERYVWQGRLQTHFDHRTEYKFSWKKKNADIPWTTEPDSGSAKLIIGATVSGNEILGFSKNTLDIPEKFYITEAKVRQVANFLSTISFVLYLALLTAATFFVILRRNHLAMHVVKNFFIAVTIVLFSLTLLDSVNYLQNTLFNYSTSVSLKSYLWLYVLRLIVSSFLVTISILMPSLSGESLQYEQFPSKREGGLRHYILSAFFSRSVTRSILLGYLAAMIMFGIQSLAFYFGREFCGVWMEHRRLTQISTNYFPFLAAFILGFNASVIEEITFRIFAISWFKKVTKNTALAVLIASVLWGLSHSNYEIFPMWFRSIEVSLLGIFLSYVYLQFGIIAAIVAHYLFDVFWMTTAFLLGKSHPSDFYSSLGILVIPLLWAGIAFVVNTSDQENQMRWKLNRHQIFNLKVLSHFLNNHRALADWSQEDIRKELISHGWDIAVIEAALEGYAKKRA